MSTVWRIVRRAEAHRLLQYACFAVALIQPASQQTTATIGGVVRATDEAGTPVRLARVTANNVDRPGVGETATTDAQGRFVFRGLPAGRYAIQATKRAWLDANYGASRLGRPGVPVAVRAGESIAGLEIRMSRGAVIAGTIRDAAGEPQPAVQVRVLRFVTTNGMRALERPATGNANDPITDDDGAYRFYGLPPGDYIVVASLRLSQSGGLGGIEVHRSDVMTAAAAARGVSPAEPPLTNAPVFHPATSDMSLASRISLAPGEERTGVDIQFDWVPTARIRGVVMLATGGPPSAEVDRNMRAECRVTPAGFEDLLAQPLAAAVTTVAPDGSLLFTGIPPGRYTLTCAAGNPTSSGPTLMWAETPLVVAGQNQDVSLVLAPAGTISGRVVFEGDKPPADLAAVANIVRTGYGRARLIRPDYSASIQPDGTFAFANVISGTFAITAVPRMAKWTFKSVTLGARDLSDQPLEMHAGQHVDGVVVTLTTMPSELAGTLEDARGRPATEYFVIAFPADRARWTPTTRRIQTARPGSDGAYLIRGLPAGDYFLAALTDVEPGEWLSPAFLEQVVPAAVRVSVADAQRTVQGLRIAK
jgi:uncharacterized protein (DUF2141 family)